ncbi:MAG: N-acetylglucosamine-6-phosphate deacetylase [Pyrinomonadaceae bacterium]
MQITIELENDGGVLVEDGRIVESFARRSETGRSSGLQASSVMPGFIDIHCHGAVGVDVNTAGVEGLIKIASFLAQNGVTAWLPTLVPDSDENYRRAIDTINEVMLRQGDLPIAQVVGVHYEGVFANEKMCGALRPEYFRVGGRQLTEGIGLPKLKEGVHMTTLAPEVEGGIELIKLLVAADWIVSIGHTRANVETLDRAFAAGARHMTHFFNAMTGIHHRDIGVAGWGLVNEGVTFDIIADGIHVQPKMLGVTCRAKSPSKVSLISDSVAPTGLGDGEYELWGENITVANGRTRNERGSIAGSVCTMYDCVKMMLSLGFVDSDVASMASSNPAKLVGLDDRGSIAIGKRADLLGLDESGNIAFTMIGGEIVAK